MICIKRAVFFLFAAVLLVIGMAVGFVLRTFFPAEPILSSIRVTYVDSSAPGAEADSTTLLTTALDVLNTLKHDDWKGFSAYIDPDDGVRFTHASTVSDTDLVFTAQDLLSAVKGDSTYIWGLSTDDKTPIRLSVQDYFHSYVWDADYTNAAEIGIDTVLYAGNAMENVSSAEVYPANTRFIDFYIPSTSEHSQDWSSLKLVFAWSAERHDWYLVGVVHSGWTP